MSHYFILLCDLGNPEVVSISDYISGGEAYFEHVCS